MDANILNDNIYLQLTREFNAGQLRCILSSGQAVVLHRLAVMSKDGDWIAREDEAALDHVLAVLEAHGARYRLGAPLHTSWMAGGWSAHFEFIAPPPAIFSRVRTDFVTRPPRLSPDDLTLLWQEQEAGHAPIPFIDVRRLIELKKTDRDRDYSIIGELARRLGDAREYLLLGRSTSDLLELGAQYPELIAELTPQRPLLAHVFQGRDALRLALDAERYALMDANAKRLEGYQAAASGWHAAWPQTERAIAGLPLRAAHTVLVERATLLLPTHPKKEAQPNAPD